MCKALPRPASAFERGTEGHSRAQEPNLPPGNIDTNVNGMAFDPFMADTTGTGWSWMPTAAGRAGAHLVLSLNSGILTFSLANVFGADDFPRNPIVPGPLRPALERSDPFPILTVPEPATFGYGQGSCKLGAVWFRRRT